MLQSDFSKFTIGDYYAGSKLKIILWFFVNYYIFHSSLPWPYAMKAKILRLFGAKIGKHFVIKNRVRIKYPWRLHVGDHCWIGEDVWIDNVDYVNIGSHTCISQGAMLLTGNHDYTITNFPYRIGKILIEDGVWIGAKSVVCAGVICRAQSILTVNSVATKEMEEMKIYAGNPAQFVRMRKFIA